MATDNQFLAFQDTYIDLENNEVVRPPSVLTDLVEAPACGFWTIRWVAHHPERGQETGVMLASLQPYVDEPYARNIVAEVLWGRGYVGNYQLTTEGVPQCN